MELGIKLMELVLKILRKDTVYWKKSEEKKADGLIWGKVP